MIWSTPASLARTNCWRMSDRTGDGDGEWGLVRHTIAAATMSLVAFMAAFAADAQTNPIADSKAAGRAGKATYLRLCQYCHGADGKALENIDFEATNLTDPTRFRYGTGAPEIFGSIKNGAGHDMPAFHDKLTDDEIWQLVSFIRSIGPEEGRPIDKGD